MKSCKATDNINTVFQSMENKINNSDLERRALFETLITGKKNYLTNLPVFI